MHRTGVLAGHAEQNGTPRARAVKGHLEPGKSSPHQRGPATNGVWESMAFRALREGETAGSSPATPTVCPLPIPGYRGESAGCGCDSRGVGDPGVWGPVAGPCTKETTRRAQPCRVHALIAQWKSIPFTPGRSVVQVHLGVRRQAHSPVRRYVVGPLWCNWQHAGFWSRSFRFEPCRGSRGRGRTPSPLAEIPPCLVWLGRLPALGPATGSGGSMAERTGPRHRAVPPVRSLRCSCRLRDARRRYL